MLLVLVLLLVLVMLVLVLVILCKKVRVGDDVAGNIPQCPFLFL
jgi:hypothetical protein